MVKKTYQKALIILTIAFIYALVTYLGLFNRIDKWIQDYVFQQPKAVTGNVVVIGIDDDSLEELGAYNTWGRGNMAAALSELAQDKDNLPAVVAIDTLYTGTTAAKQDDSLVSAVAGLPKVITATAGVFGSQYIQNDDGKTDLAEHRVITYNEPYEALKNVSVQGHINAMYDLDGVLRHALLYIDVPKENGDTQRVFSMAYEAARAYQEQNGKTLLLPRTDSRGHYYLSYSAIPGTYDDGYNIADLIRGDVPSDYYAGKIVLIGPYSVGLQDEYFTTIDRAKKMYGVEVQANAIEAFLRNDYKYEMSDELQALIVLLLCAALLSLFLKLKLVPSGILMTVIGAATFIGAYIFYDNGMLVHPLWFPLGTLVMYVVAVGIKYFRSAIEKMKITRTFERYVAPEIVDEILKEGVDNLSLGGKTCDIAVLFVDVRGFTTMSEHLSPEKVVYVLNKYLTMASDCVERNKGTLDKFVGDAMMAFWGAPLPQESAVYNSVKTAMEIIDGASKVSDELKEEIGVELQVGIGINYGPAVVGNMGAEKHMDYTAIGDTVNTAARLESNAPAGTLYVSRAVVDQLGSKIRYTSLGSSIRLKGKAEGFEVLKVEELL
ncbi:adenylate/guanylate cyclase domain-containing protein [Butyrivibrio sp. NC2007]|uniref:adenylate/guanylate cyclase domain-containing protein n=1 Tax=Butyrivibrio sp. NC2007 TaxID=1280683 RepID=UPI0003B5A95C|nr:adenylate/guanylate cyclase domain-containing protein [Butyrivibrio sp. NC2007]